MFKAVIFLPVTVYICVTFRASSGYITGIAVRLPLQGERAAPGAPWPLPQEWINSTEVKTLNPRDIHLYDNAANCDLTNMAFERYKALISLDDQAQADESLHRILAVNIHIQNFFCSDSHYPSMASSEEYTLTVGYSNTVEITCREIWGALRALETFSQLVYLSDDKKYRINRTEIRDFPRFAYRGLLIDTARHFMPVPIIMKILDAMSWDKLNVLHWHVVDDQSFPYPLKTYPNMSEFGAYTPYHRYSRQDVSDIIREARLRGIRVVPEFDTPGHTNSWGRALPRLITPCWGEGLSGGPYRPNYPLHGAAEIMNPMDEYVYAVMDEILQEIITDFPDNYIHLGFDEVYHACWESNPNIAEWNMTMNFTHKSDIEEYYQMRIIDIVKKYGSQYMIWQDPIDIGVTVDSDALVEVWKDAYMGQPGQFLNWQVYMRDVTSRGYQTILSAPWYLNVISYGQDWKKYYEIEPTNFTADANDSTRDQVKGGEACSWSEYIDGTDLLSLLWPRASAVAERLWSSASARDTNSAAFRLDQQRCRFVRRGIPAKPILPGYCGDYEWDFSAAGGGSGASRPKLQPILKLFLAILINVFVCSTFI